VEGRGLGEAQQIANFGAGERRVREIALGRVAAKLVEDLLERRPFFSEASLQRPRTRPETACEGGQIRAAAR